MASDRTLWRQGIEVFVNMSTSVYKNHGKIDEEDAKEFLKEAEQLM